MLKHKYFWFIQHIEILDLLDCDNKAIMEDQLNSDNKYLNKIDGHKVMELANRPTTGTNEESYCSNSNNWNIICVFWQV